jgi:predicted neuraminidase
MRRYPCGILILLPLCCLHALSTRAIGCDETGQAAIVRSEFVYEKGSIPSCHASTIVQSGGKLLVAFFGGSDEGNDDVEIWLSERQIQGWSAPRRVADGRTSTGRQYPCWNPVLVPDPHGDLYLFYKVGPSPSQWWGEWKRSADSGRTWSAPLRLPEGILGPVKNKPLLLAGGRLLCGSSTEHDGWRIHLESTSDWGKTWVKSAPLNDGRQLGLIQPTLLCHAGGRLQLLCRSRQRRIAESWSSDCGRTWSAPALTALPNPNSGIDAVSLADGTHLLVYNHTTSGRSPLNVAVTRDGRRWFAGAVLEADGQEYSYPAVVQSSDGLVQLTYTWRRQRIRHATIDHAKLRWVEIVDGAWPQ